MEAGDVDAFRQFDPQNIPALRLGDAGGHWKIAADGQPHGLDLPFVTAAQGAQMAFIGAGFEIFGQYQLGNWIGAAAGDGFLQSNRLAMAPRRDKADAH